LILKQKTLDPTACAGATSRGFFTLIWEFQSFFITLLNVFLPRTSYSQ